MGQFVDAHHWGRPGLLLHRRQECTAELLQHSRLGIQLKAPQERQMINFRIIP